jgi:A/G-specific adenine glycosylase
VDIRSLGTWFEKNHRPLPWRAPSCSPWGVLVSEVMLQQTPVARVEPVWREWMSRWPSPADLARASQAEAVSAWGRLGYPRRAMRLHRAAQSLVAEHGGQVPHDLDSLLALPGVGDYTARAIRTFAWGIPESVVDTNVRRVVQRAAAGQGEAGPPRARADRDALWELLSPLEDAEQVLLAKAVMELGAIVCTARAPRCGACPIQDTCAWRQAGYPRYEGAKAPTQARFEGSDRQVRGIIMRELRHSDIPVPESFLATLWPNSDQFQRALASLLDDGLLARSDEGLSLAS